MTSGARLVMLGRQGSGKGTQCARLSRHYVVPHISTGDILRAAVRDGTEFGRRAQKLMDAGELIPDEIIIGVVQERLSRDSRARGFIFDGFPRTVHQAGELLRIAGDRGIDLAVNLEVPRDVVVARLVARRVCQDCGTNYSVHQPPKYAWTCDMCGGDVVHREDDSESAIIRRLDLYEEQTSPLMRWFEERQLLATVDGMGSQDEVAYRLVEVIDTRLLAR
jgi:adenylate kinase